MSDSKSDTASATERKKRFTTLSGLPVERLYTPESLEHWNAEEALGYPGEYPYTRGIYPTMYRGRFWTMRQYAGFGSAAESNERYRYLLGKGQMGLSVAFDSLEDMETLFDRIPLEKVSTSMTINASAAILLCLYVAVAKKQGADLK